MNAVARACRKIFVKKNLMSRFVYGVSKITISSKRIDTVSIRQWCSVISIWFSRAAFVMATHSCSLWTVWMGVNKWLFSLITETFSNLDELLCTLYAMSRSDVESPFVADCRTCLCFVLILFSIFLFAFPRCCSGFFSSRRHKIIKLFLCMFIGKHDREPTLYLLFV